MSQPNYQPIDPTRLKTYSIRDREHKAETSSFAALTKKGCTAADLIASWPRYLGAEQFRGLVAAITSARRGGRPVVFALGAHVVKVGCSPIIIDLIEREIITAVAMNGATAIHDVEIATVGQTSEEVAETIHSGRFGMVRETADLIGTALRGAEAETTGFGRALGRAVIDSQPDHLEHCILAAAYRTGIPVTIHVAMGTDTVHMLAPVDGAALGRASMFDFRLLCAIVGDLSAGPESDTGGVWCNVGSAVVLPEVFLKAVAVARNLGADLDSMHTANLDMIRHYRPGQNVIGRPVRPGHGHEIIGHHEILLPLLRQALIETMG